MRYYVNLRIFLLLQRFLILSETFYSVTPRRLNTAPRPPNIRFPGLSPTAASNPFWRAFLSMPGMIQDGWSVMGNMSCTNETARTKRSDSIEPFEQCRKGVVVEHHRIHLPIHLHTEQYHIIVMSEDRVHRMHSKLLWRR